MITVLYPNSSCLDIMGLIRTDLATCKVHLFKEDIIPTMSTILSDLEAAEADFGGYAAIAVTALLPSYIDPLGGAACQIATVQFDADGTLTGNICYGFWVDVGASPNTKLRLVGRFEQGVPMGSAGDALPLDIKFSFGAGQV